jgi:hypothetical protein
MLRGLALAAVCLSVHVLPLGAQELPCAEFPVNTHTLGHQASPAVASAPDGRLLVVWVGEQDGGGEGVSGRLYDALGTPQEAEFRVNTFTAPAQFSFPSAASDGRGNFVVVWMNHDQDGSQAGIFGQRFGPDGAPQGMEFRVNTYTEGSQTTPKVAAAAGGFVVVWRSDGQDGSAGGVFCQRYDAAGAAQGPEFQVHTHTPGPQSYPAVSARPDGQFVVVWESFGQDEDHRGVFGQRFDEGGTPQGGEFPIHTFTTFAQAYARVAHRLDGGFVTVWTMNDGANFQIFGRTFDPSGDPEGPAFRINTDTSGLQDQPAITRGSDGGFIVVWTRNTLGGGADIAGRRLDSSGAPLGPEFAVAGSTTVDQSQPHVAAMPNGGFVAAWQSEDQDGSGFGVFASRDCARLYTVGPCRVADTRDPTGPSGGPPLAANAARSFPVSGLCGIPADARAVVLNATAVNPSEAGNLRLYPAGQAAPLASALNFAPGLTRANNAVVPLGTDGQIGVQCDMAPGSSGSTNLVLDVSGYFKR